jgi:hypothetical protein
VRFARYSHGLRIRIFKFAQAHDLATVRHQIVRKVVFDERRKIHDLLMEGVELALKKRGYAALADMRAKWQRKER